MRADAEGGMEDRLARDVDFFWLFHCARIARGGTPGQHHEIALLHRGASNFHIARAGAAKRDNRRKYATEFFNRVFDQVGIIEQLLAHFRMLGQIVDRRRHHEGGGGNPAKGQVDQDADLVLPRCLGAILIRHPLQDSVDHIAAGGLRFAPFEMGIEIGEHAAHMRRAIFGR